MNQDTPETILLNMVAVLEEHTKILQNYRQYFERLSVEITEVNRKLDELQSADGSIDSSDAKFIMDVSTRLKAISTSLKERT